MPVTEEARTLAQKERPVITSQINLHMEMMQKFYLSDHKSL
jgi:hypothetical protein